MFTDKFPNWQFTPHFIFYLLGTFPGALNTSHIFLYKQLIFLIRRFDTKFHSISTFQDMWQVHRDSPSEHWPAPVVRSLSRRERLANVPARPSRELWTPEPRTPLRRNKSTPAEFCRSSHLLLITNQPDPKVTRRSLVKPFFVPLWSLAASASLCYYTTTMSLRYTLTHVSLRGKPIWETREAPRTQVSP